MHRGDEKLLEVRDFRQGLSLINRHNWLTPIAAEIAYAQACEELMGLRPSPRAIATRELIRTLQEITGLLQRLAGISGDKALLDLREKFVVIHERIVGARMHDSAIRPGGIDATIDEEIRNQISQVSTEELPTIDTTAFTQRGILTAEIVAEFAMTAIPASTHDSADRIDFTRSHTVSLMASLVSLTDDAINASGNLTTTLPKVVRVPVGESYQTSFGATGRVGVWLFSDGGKSPYRIALRSPSAIHMSALDALAHNLNIEDKRALLLTLPLSLGEIDR
jgi:NADH-quinone oxidoreductase subunit D